MIILATRDFLFLKFTHKIPTENRKNRTGRRRTFDRVGAFAFYATLGSTRRLQAVASKFGMTYDYIRQIAAKDNWTSRVREIEVQVERSIKQQIIEQREITYSLALGLRKAAFIRAGQLLAQTKSISACRHAWEMARIELGLPTRVSVRSPEKTAHTPSGIVLAGYPKEASTNITQ